MIETKRIKRSLIDPSPTNPRKRFNPEKLQELAESLRKHGLQTEIWVRRSARSQTKGGERYELIAGERRWRAAEIAGIEELPCKVYEGFSDAAIIELQLIENLDREDLTAVEEAESYRGLMEKSGYTAETLMSKFSRSRAHIFSRLKLLKLEGPVREALEGGTIPPTIADLLSQVPARYQAEALKDVCARGEVMSFRQARDFLNDNYTADLQGVKWNMDDRTLLPAAGDCASCPKRAENCLELFPELKRKPNTCTDLDCFGQKKTAYRVRLLAEESKRGKVLTLDQCDQAFEEWGHLRHEGEWTDLGDFGVYTGRDYIRAADKLKKPKSDCFAAVTPRGEVRRLYRKADLTAEMADAGFVAAEPKQRTTEATESAEEKAKREARERLNNEIFAAAEKRVAEAVTKRIAQIGPVAKGERKLWLLALSGIGVGQSPAERHGLTREDFYDSDRAARFAESVKKWPDEKLRSFVVECAISEDWSDGYNRQRLEFAAELLGVDAKAIGKEVRQELTAKAKETLVHKVAHGKDLEKPAKRQKSKTGSESGEQLGLEGVFTVEGEGKEASEGKPVLGAAARKRLAEAARDRWAKARQTRAAA